MNLSLLLYEAKIYSEAAVFLFWFLREDNDVMVSFTWVLPSSGISQDVEFLVEFLGLAKREDFFPSTDIFL